MTFKPTPEQEAILSAARDSDDNLSIQALAGAAKTSTLMLIAEALPQEEILCLAFNKIIAKEMTERLPQNAAAQTLNSLGHRAWSAAYGRRLKLDSRKTWRLTRAAIEEEKSSKTRDDLFAEMSTLMRAVSTAKHSGWVPISHAERSPQFGTPRPLIADDDEFFDLHIDENLTESEVRTVKRIMRASIEEAMTGTIDFDDQIYMPAIWRAPFARPSLVMVDEAQDLSSINHRLLDKIAKRRLIAVGDPCQAIYGFRGAESDSMSHLSRDFKCRELMLSVSFRCPSRIVEHAQWRAPHMKAWRKGGEIHRPERWSLHAVPEGAFILCRNNAPLFSLAVKFLKHRRPMELRGNDVGKALTKVMRDLGPEDMTTQKAHDALDLWVTRQCARVKNTARVHDMAECIRAVLDENDTLGNAIFHLEQVLNQHGTIKLMTGHKSKGLEAADVFILDEHLIGAFDRRQGEPESEGEQNLRYVMQTRATNSLTYVETETLQED